MAKIKEFEEFVSAGSSIIKDPAVFEVSYPPPEIVKRAETEKVFKEVSTFVNYRIPHHLLLTGLPGLGKTVTVRYICGREILADKGVISVYVNCREKNSSQILTEILEDLDVETFSHGYLKNVGIPDLIKSVLSTFSTPLLLVLDEVDRGRNIESLLYMLSRTREIDPIEHPPVSLILVSNNLGWEDSLDKSVRSSLQLTNIAFKPYNEAQLKDILYERVKLGLKKSESIPIEIINEIAKKTVDEKRGDCRIALKALMYAAQAIDQAGEKYDKVNLISTFQSAAKEIESERIVNLNDTQLLILQAICEHEGASFAEIYHCYADNASDLKRIPLSHTMVYHWVKYLFYQGLVGIQTFRTRTEKAPKKVLEIRLCIDPEVVSEEMSRRMHKLATD